MKIARHVRHQGDTVYLRDGPERPDVVWISCVFDWNKPKALKLARKYKRRGSVVHVGGSGIDVDSKLPPEIEAELPDYSLYPGDDRAVGFGKRGCNRRCGFCIVPKKEGWLRDNVYRPVSSWSQGRKKILLLDNNIAQADEHDAILEDCRTNSLKLCITQGYDIRCMTPERARILAQDKPWSLNFKHRRLYIAWDYFYIEPYVTRGIRMLLEAGFKGREIMCYCLAGYPLEKGGTTPEQDMHRVKTLAGFGVLPYIMPYNRNSNPNYPGYLRNLTRWVNGRFYKFVPFEKYDPSIGHGRR